MNFPGPKDLGMSDNNYAMPSRFFPNKKGEITWEDYENKLKELYPIKFFFAYTLYKFVHYKCWIPFWAPINRKIYWLKCHLLPKHRYHWLDLRQSHSDINDCDRYTHGWIDVCQKIVLANFNLLCEFADKEMYFNPSDKEIEDSSEENGEKTMFLRQRHNHDEIMAIYNWWKVERKEDAKAKDELQHNWYKLHQEDPQSPETAEASKAMRDADESFTLKEEEMLIRLIKIRNCLWS